MKYRALASVFALLLLGSAGAAPGQGTTPSPAAEAAAASEAPASFDPEAATRAYLDRVPPDQKARSDAYFEGGYWLQLWGFLYGLAVALLLLASGLSRRLRDFAGRITRFRPIRNFIYGVGYILLATLLSLPLTLYQGFFREHQYDLSNQTLSEWLADFAKGVGVSVVLGSLVFVAIYAVLRRAPRTWWVWASVVVIAFLAVSVVIAPVYIDPLFNKYTPLEDPRVSGPILSMAAANGVPVDNVWVFDASKQSKRISANVSGLFGTERVRLNDNLLNRTSLPEIEMVMGHELGHYVLNHVYEMLIELGLLVVVGFAFVRLTFERVRSRWGARWGVKGIDDPAGLPLVLALLSVFFFVATPLLNTIIRVNEAEADLFGLNASRQPDGFAEVALKLGEYRKLDPGPVEEWIFFDHPSGRERILMAMRFKAAQLAAGETAAPAGTPAVGEPPAAAPTGPAPGATSGGGG
jgi:STE24 endopeptidase